MLNKRQELFLSATEGKLSVQDRAIGRLQDQIIEEIKELESTKTEEALQIAVRKKKQKGCRESLGHHQEI